MSPLLHFEVDLTRLTSRFPQTTLTPSKNVAGIQFIPVGITASMLRLTIAPHARPRGRFFYEGTVPFDICWTRPLSEGPDRFRPLLSCVSAASFTNTEQSNVAGSLFSIRIARSRYGPVASANLSRFTLAQVTAFN